MTRSRRLAISSVLAIAALALPVSGAGAAVTIGQTFTPASDASSDCGDNATGLQTVSPNNQYAAPSRGVITSWSFQASASPVPTLKLKVGRAAGGNNYTTVGESDLRAPLPGTFSTFPTRISVEAGDVIGAYYLEGDGGCAAPPAGYVAHAAAGEQAVGSTATYTPLTDVQLDLEANLEPDADSDGFGDETQDQCPSNASVQGPCPPPPALPDTSAPNTTITKGAPNKTDAEKVKIKFGSSEPNSTFECKVGSKPYKPCTSPKKVTVEEGKNKFKVRAKDAAGNVDPTPAKETFKGVE